MTKLIHSSLLLFTLLINGCSSLYFKTLEETPTVAGRSLANWPWEEYWTGIIFNGEKIGFSHQELITENGEIKILSEAALRFHFLFVDKQLAFISEDIVADDLQLQHLEYDYKLDNSRRKIKGHRENNQLILQVGDASHVEEKTLPVEGKLYPMNALYLYPAHHGLEVGKKYHFQVFNGETLSIHPVEQKIIAYQSSELFAPKAFKLETELLGFSTTTWIDAKGLPQFELSSNGVIISALEDEETARKYLTQAALSKNDYLLDFSRIKINNNISEPRSLMFLKVKLSGTPDHFTMPMVANQTCRKHNDAWLCQLQRNSATSTPATEANNAGYLQASFTINSTASSIDKLAKEISLNTKDQNEQVTNILNWLYNNIEKQAVDTFNALGVLKQGKAECQGHSYLYAALARNLGIPTRLINGLVYSKQFEGFLYHTWVESFVDDHWQAIDPILGQRHADATHIALLEGETLADLTPLISLIGKLKVELLE